MPVDESHRSEAKTVHHENGVIVQRLSTGRYYARWEEGRRVSGLYFAHGFATGMEGKWPHAALQAALADYSIEDERHGQ